MKTCAHTLNPILFIQKENSINFFKLITIFLATLLACNLSTWGQTVIYSTGFETGNTAMTHSAGTNTVITQPNATDARTGSKSGKISANGTNKSFTGSIVTSTQITFSAGKSYFISVYAKTSGVVSTLKIKKATTNTNAAMVAATGSDIILDAASPNVTSATYVQFTGVYTPSVTESNKYVGFQITAGNSGGTLSVGYIDDIRIIEQNVVSNLCAPTSASSAHNIDNFTTSGSGTNITNNGSGYSYPGIGRFTNFIVSRTVGQTVGFNVNAGNTSLTYGVSVWVDWNKDGSFSSSEKMYANAGNWVSTPLSGSFTVPTTASNGDYTMRVAIDYYGTGTSMDACSFVLGGVGANAGRFGESEDYTLRIDNTPLPVELMSFSANCQNSDVELAWSTASEHNNMHFIVENSKDGIEWTVLDVVPSVGLNTTTVQNYSLVHSGAGRELNYYRLTQVDVDGLQKEYNTVVANCHQNSVSTIITYPNPSSNDFTVVLNDDRFEGEVSLNILDTRGVLVFAQSLDLAKGVQSFLVHAEDVPPGIYFIQIVNKSLTTNTVKHSFL